ncbi:MAG: hypothetical protein AB1646_18840 [Thermodesulfobacteriota bacterium]
MWRLRYPYGQLCIGLSLLFMAAGTPAFGVEALIEEAGVVFDLPDVWTSIVKNSRIPTGQLMQNWKRAPMAIQAGEARPGIIAMATPVPQDSDLVFLTQAVLSGEPYRVRLAELDCMKCCRYKVRMPEGTLGAFSFEPPPNCHEKPGLDDPELACQFEQVNLVNLKLEPSWAFRMKKDVPGLKMKGIVLHALVDGKLLDVSFWYPAELDKVVEPEIMSIISSLRTKQ